MHTQKIDYNLQQLKNLAIRDTLPHAILLHGEIEPTYLLATNFAKYLFCNVDNNSNVICNCTGCTIFTSNNHPDYFLIDLGVNQEIKIDLTREATNFANTTPYLAKRKIILINNFHNINQQATNALLKTLEEPPITSAILFLLITDNLKSLPATILSRVLRFNIVPNITTNNKDYNSDKQADLLQDLYAIWVQEKVNLIINIVEKWQLLPKKQLIDCLWFIVTNIIKIGSNGQYLEIKKKISPQIPWQLLDSLNYINKLMIFGYQINWQLFLYNFIMTTFTGSNIYVTGTRF